MKTIKIGDRIAVDLGGIGPADLVVLSIKRDYVVLKYIWSGKVITLTKKDLENLS